MLSFCPGSFCPRPECEILESTAVTTGWHEPDLNSEQASEWRQGTAPPGRGRGRGWGGGAEIVPLLVTGARTCPAVLSATVPRSARGLRGAFSDEESYVETTELSKNIFGRLIEEDAKMTQAQESGVSRWDAARPLGDRGPSAARGAGRGAPSAPP